jgi:hypothetical protein
MQHELLFSLSRHVARSIHALLPVLPSHATRRGKLLVLHIHSLDSNKSGDGVVVFVRAAHKVICAIVYINVIFVKTIIT